MNVVPRTVTIQWREAGQDAGTPREVTVPSVNPRVPGLLVCRAVLAVDPLRLADAWVGRHHSGFCMPWAHQHAADAVAWAREVATLVDWTADAGTLRQRVKDPAILRELHRAAVRWYASELLACGHLADLEFGICPVCPPPGGWDQ